MFHICMKDCGHDSPRANLTDWQVMSPTGPISPRSLLGARILREIPEETREELRALKRNG
jgi:hypothetical protein